MFSHSRAYAKTSRIVFLGNGAPSVSLTAKSLRRILGLIHADPRTTGRNPEFSLRNHANIWQPVELRSDYEHWRRGRSQRSRRPRGAAEETSFVAPESQDMAHRGAMQREFSESESQHSREESLATENHEVRPSYFSILAEPFVKTRARKANGIVLSVLEVPKGPTKQSRNSGWLVEEQISPMRHET